MTCHFWGMINNTGNTNKGTSGETKKKGRVRYWTTCWKGQTGLAGAQDPGPGLATDGDY